MTFVPNQPSSSTEKWTLIGKSNGRANQASDSSSADSGLPSEIPVQGGSFQCLWHRIESGPGEGLELLGIGNGLITAIIIPGRGMGIWKCFSGPFDLGWQSPVCGPVHPKFVPVMDASGIGWLEGFDEFLVRCGLESNGAPQFDSQGRLQYPLHGRIANLPANHLEVSIDVKNGTLDVIGKVNETRFLIRNLELTVAYRFSVNSPIIEVTDTVTNKSSKSTTIQMLYHINQGQPLLEAGSTVSGAFSELAPRNDHAASAIDKWHEYEGPHTGFEEQVYFAKPIANPKGWSTVMLQNSRKTQGVAIRFDTRTLPFFNLWKNTAAVEDGYVTGLEPATGFPNPRSFEEAQARVVELAGGQSRTFRLHIEPLSTPEQVSATEKEISELQTSSCTTHRSPKSGWSS